MLSGFTILYTRKFSVLFPLTSPNKYKVLKIFGTYTIIPVSGGWLVDGLFNHALSTEGFAWL